MEEGSALQERAAARREKEKVRVFQGHFVWYTHNQVRPQWTCSSNLPNSDLDNVDTLLSLIFRATLSSDRKVFHIILSIERQWRKRR